jgi:hypothetical protein
LHRGRNISGFRFLIVLLSAAKREFLIKFENRSDKCLLKFYPKKCKHMNIHRTPKEEEVKYNLLGQEIS